MWKTIHSLLITGLCLTLTACPSGGVGQSDAIKTTDDLRKRKHMKTEITMADYKALAEDVTNEILSSDLAEEWSKKKEKPRLIVGNLRNFTDNENIRVKDIQGKITQTLLKSDLVRVLDSQSRSSFDFIIRSKLTSTRQKSQRGEMVEYSLSMELYTMEGEMKGKWSDNMRLSR